MGTARAERRRKKTKHPIFHVDLPKLIQISAVTPLSSPYSRPTFGRVIALCPMRPLPFQLPPVLQRLVANKHFKYGLPFLILVVGSPFILKDFQQVKIERRQKKFVSADLEEKAKDLGIVKKEDVTPEKIHEEYMQKDYQDDYEIVRGPRPWEESSLGLGNKKVQPVIKSKNSYGI